MSRRPTIKDIAAEAGVSVATVNRVLAGTVAVRAETGRKVSEAARRIGYHGTNLISQRLRSDLPLVRFGFVLQKEKQSFYQNLVRHLEEAVENLETVRGELVVEFAPSQSPNAVSEILLDIADRVDVVGATAVNHHLVNDAVRVLNKRGVPTFSIFSDFAQGERVNYIGMNNLKIGRGAGWLLAKTARKPGKIALFVGGHRWHGHDLREAGFRSFFREHLPRFDVLDTLVNLETRVLTHEATLDLLSRHPDVVGIYVAAGGMEGAITALMEERKPGEVALVVNELTEESRAGLASGYVNAVFGTPLEPLCAELVGYMVQATQGDTASIPGQRFFDTVLHVPELT
ncbi:LacI family DNA-binding transcriptional regulator [uncultured Litoreibacter sp.]|uniref:LacI family DNA-binding transcriptional regulator n=1 Tax=uncultured Litoreibacter sp. TaxID=1392394 RepID=UPI002635C29D|nr:LacI family DNA-binding transcriptional regulator [uncultured Litoreibacter sp.]